MVQLPKVHEDAVHAVDFSPDGRLLASGGQDKNIILWNCEEGEMPQKLLSLSGHDNWIFDLDFSPDGKLLASGGNDRTVRLWAVKDASEEQK